MPNVNKSSVNHAALLRNDLLKCAEMYLSSENLDIHVYRSRGKVPVVLFRVFSAGSQHKHGNFHDESFASIVGNANWVRRLEKAHSGKTRGWFNTADAANARELDSCTSSDALAMNIFCHPSIANNERLAQMLGFGRLPEPDFGFKAQLPFEAGGCEIRSTEIDIRLHSAQQTVLLECKLTEPDFMSRPRAAVQRYASFNETFNVLQLPRENDDFLHYQLIRNVLAARHHEARFVLICDSRRPDLQQAFNEVVNAIIDPQLRDRCSVITWQTINTTLPQCLQSFLALKYGIN